MPKNPRWTRDELILALDLYFKAERHQLDAKHPEVVSLSNLLNQLAIHDDSQRYDDFRNPQGVSMKLGNFLRLDPEHQTSGLAHGSKSDEEVWNEFATDPVRLSHVAQSIRIVNAQTTQAGKSSPSSSEDEDEFVEGKILARVHIARERSRTAVRKKKAKVLRETEKLACEVCGFDFKEYYGSIGEGFAECHHKVPLSELGNVTRTRLADLAIVCANCHRMLHQGSSVRSVDELRQLLL